MLAKLDLDRAQAMLNRRTIKSPVEMFRNITPGMKAEIRPETGEEGDFIATVAIVDRVIDPASGTFGVRLELPNPDYRLPGGLKCMVRFLDDTETASPAKTPGNKKEADKIADGLQPDPLLLSSVK